MSQVVPTLPLPDLPVLSESERSCLRRYVDMLVQTLGNQLVEVAVLGSVARGESWPRGMSIRSDLDLLVVTETPLSENMIETLIDATLPLFLESGRQIGPQFRTREGVANPRDERASEFVEHLQRDAVRIYESEAAAASRRFRQ